MSVKRQATTELNHENWDQDDPEDHEEMGSFKAASKDVLEKRVIRTAKRRAPASDEAKKTIFGGFSGFNKTQPSSFDFLSKLTNGSNSTESSKTDTSTPSLFSSKPESTSSLFNSKPESSTSLFASKAASPSSGTGIFGNPTSPANSSFGTVPTTQPSSLFAIPSTNSSSPGVFTTPKANTSASDSPFKTQNATSSSENNTSSQVPSAPVAFGIPTTSSASKPMFTATSNSSPFKIQATPNTTNAFGTSTKTEAAPSEPSNPDEEKKNEKKLTYYSKLKGLNESVSSWVKQHVEKTPLCILSPIFRDYEVYLKEIQEEFHGTSDEGEKKTNNVSATPETKPQLLSSGKEIETKKTNSIGFSSTTNPVEQNASTKPAVTPESNKGSSLFKLPTSKSPFANQNNTATEKPGTFSFGIKSSPPSTTNATPTGFSFGVATSSTTTPTSTPSFSATFGTATTNSSSFSFGTGKPFSFNSNVAQQNSEKKDDANEEEDAPPKVDFTPIVEENSIFDKRCKVFVKKDGNFVDKGVGTLYLKKVEESGKHQLLIRANTNLGTILVNLILVSGIPTQRMGKNNVMLVCIPTPDAKPPPTPILIRVKTSEEADELLETLNKYKT